MNPLPRFSRVGSVRVVERAAPPLPGVTTWVADEQVGIDVRLLQHFSFAQPTPFTYDLMTVVSAIRCADRQIQRVHSEGWARELAVEIPVYEHSRWRAKETQALLGKALSYLTGDEWQFTFRARRSRFKPPHERLLDLRSDAKARFIPYSHGLDSFAQLRLLQSRDPDVQHVCVYADTRQMSGGWKEFCRSSKHRRIKPIRVPLRFDDPHHAEPTFRTRPFVYYMLTAYGAMTTKATEVIIPENGQGSIGGSLALLGAEAPHRSCHPGFTSRLSQLFQHLSGHRVEFRHPGLFSTKADVLSALVEVEGDGKRWMPEHWSCSHDQRHATANHRRIHCGLCGNCILRRSAAMAANIEDETTYLFQDLTSRSMESGLLPGAKHPRGHRAYEDLASNGARSMQRLADLALDEDALAIWSESANIAEAQCRPIAEVKGDLTRLLKRHAEQWNTFLSQCGRDSWMATMARG